MDSRETANFGPSMVSPALRRSNVAVMISLPRASLRPDGPAAAGTDHVALLVEAPGVRGRGGGGAGNGGGGGGEGKQRQEVDRGGRDEPAITGGFGVDFVEIDRVSFTDRSAIQLNGVPRQRVRDGLARLAGND